jgi:hypothetical protein
MSLYTSSSNFRFLSQGVAAAIQKRHLLVGPACAPGRGEAVAGIPTTLKAAAAPKPSRNVLRVVMLFLLSLLSRFPATEVYAKPLAKRKAKEIISPTTHAVIAADGD